MSSSARRSRHTPTPDGSVATVLAFFFAVGIAAHAFDELQGRPLGTTIPTAWLVGAGAGSLVLACGIGVIGITTVGFGLLIFIAIGPLLVLGYNLELFGGRMHTDFAFAAAWGAFPVLVGYFAQAERLDLTAVLGAAAALGFSLAQRVVSTPARALRRRVARVAGSVTMYDGTTHELEVRMLLRPLERALGSMSWAIVALALALVVARVL